MLKGARIYLAFRGASLLLSFGLSFWYSKNLGPENRSILTFIFLSGLLCISTLIVPTQIYIRNLDELDHDFKTIVSYSLLSLIVSCLSTFLSFLFFLFYMHEKTYNSFNLSLITLLYLFTSSISFCFYDLFLGLAKSQMLATVDLLTTIGQVVFFLIFYKLNLFSTIVNVLLAIMFSYLCQISFYFFLLNTNLISHFSLNALLDLLRSSKRYWFYTLINSIADKLDKVYIAFLLPLSYLSKYVVAASLLSMIRVMLDEVIKFMTSNSKIRVSSSNTLFRIPFISSVSFTLGSMLVINPFINVTLGESWILPIGVIVALTIQEVTRANFALHFIPRIKLATTNNLINRRLVLSFVALLILLPVFIRLLGIYGAPICMTVFYFCSYQRTRIVQSD